MSPRPAPRREERGRRDRRRGCRAGPAGADRHGAAGARGYFERSQLDAYGTLGSPFGDHPNMYQVPVVDFPSGSIGHNLAVSVGMALALRHRGSPAEVLDLEPVSRKWEAFGWEVRHLPDGHDMAGVVDVLGQALDGTGDRPRVVLADTVVGKGVSFMEGHWQRHQGHLGPADRQRALDEIEKGLA